MTRTQRVPAGVRCYHKGCEQQAIDEIFDDAGLSIGAYCYVHLCEQLIMRAAAVPAEVIWGAKHEH